MINQTLQISSPQEEAQFRQAAAEKGMSPQAVETYIASHKGYISPVNQSTPPANLSSPDQGLGQSPSLISRIGSGVIGLGKAIVNPVVGLGRDVGEGLALLTGADKQYQDSQDSVLSQAHLMTDQGAKLIAQGKVEEGKNLIRKAQTITAGISQEQAGRSTEMGNKQIQTVKDAVGTGALFVPGGGETMAGKIAAGATTGAMAGFGSSKKGEELSGTVGGAVTGGVIGAAAGLLGKVVNKMKAGNTAVAAGVQDTSGLNPEIINPQVKATPFYMSDKNTLMNTAKDIGIAANDTTETAFPKIESAFKDSSREIQGLLTDAPPLQQDTILNSLAKQLDNTDFTPGDSTYESKLMTQLGKLEKMGPEINPVDIYAMKSDLGGTLSPVFKKIEAGNPLTKNEEVRASMYYALKEALDGISPDIAKINNLQHDLYTLSEGLVKSSQKSGNITPRLFGVKFELPLSYQRIQSMGQIGKNTLGGVSNAINKSALEVGNTPITRNLILGDTVQKFNGPLGSSPGEEFPQPSDTSEKQQYGPVSNEENAGGTNNENYNLNHTPNVTPVSSTSQGPNSTSDTLNPYGASPETIYSAFIKAQNEGNKRKANLLHQMWQDEVSYQEKATKVKSTANANLGNVIDQMQTLYGAGTKDSLSAGNNTVGLGGLGTQAGIHYKKLSNQDYVDKLTQYNQMRALAVGILNKARQAGTLNAGEYEIMVNNMPNEYSSEPSAAAWFKNVRKLLPTIEAQQQQGLGATPQDAML